MFTFLTSCLTRFGRSCHAFAPKARYFPCPREIFQRHLDRLASDKDKLVMFFCHLESWWGGSHREKPGFCSLSYGLSQGQQRQPSLTFIAEEIMSLTRARAKELRMSQRTRITKHTTNVAGLDTWVYHPEELGRSIFGETLLWDLNGKRNISVWEAWPLTKLSGGPMYRGRVFLYGHRMGLGYYQLKLSSDTDKWGNICPSSTGSWWLVYRKLIHKALEER